MTAFEHVTALLSFVYALGLTHLLVRIAELIVARERIKFSGLLALGMANAILPGLCRLVVALGSSFDQELGSCLRHHPVPRRRFRLSELLIGRTKGSRRR